MHQFFDPVTADLRVSAENLETTRKQLEGRIPEAVKANLDGVAARLKAVTDSLEGLHGLYENMLASIFPTLTKSATKGAVSCEMLFTDLQDSFREDCFENVSRRARFTDILGTPSFAAQPILIEVKDYSGPVPSSEVDKFWRDMEVQGARIGCFFSTRTSISTITRDFAIVPQGSRIAIFVVNEVFDHRGHIFGYTVARKMLEMISSRGVTVEAEKYEWMAKVLNNRLQELRDKMRDLESIENTIIKAQETITKTLGNVAMQVLKLRTSIETIIEAAFQDFSEEICES